MSDEIIDCNGKYEVHPAHGSWAVVNGETGIVHSETSSREEAVRLARELNQQVEE
jgi:hypothetical protein